MLIKQRMISGLLVLVPLGITFFVLSILFHATVGVAASIVGTFLRDVPTPALYGASFAFMLIGVYLVGLFASNILGKRFIELSEALFQRIPIVQTVYSASKQVVELFQRRPEEHGQQVVLVDFPAPGLKAVGFMTGSSTLPDGTLCRTVFIPTTPNPTTGFLELIPAERVQPLDINAEAAFRIIMSGGLLAPPHLGAASKGAAHASSVVE